MSGNGIRWARCQSAPRSRQITTPAPHHSVLYRPDALPATQPTASKHWRHIHYLQENTTKFAAYTFVVKEACPKWLMICSFVRNLGSTQSRRTPQMNVGIVFLTNRDCHATKNHRQLTCRIVTVTATKSLILRPPLGEWRCIIKQSSACFPVSIGRQEKQGINKQKLCIICGAGSM